MAKTKKILNNKKKASGGGKNRKAESTHHNSRMAAEESRKSDEDLKHEAIDYDSMIENGTSEDEEDEDSNGESEGSDGFSDKESESVEKKPASKPALKRKPEELLDQKRDPQTKKPKNAAASAEKVKAPTLEEINELKETRNLFHSNLFRLQIKEMLDEIKVKDKYLKYINSFMESFKKFVKSIPDMPEKESIDSLTFLKKTHIATPLNLQSLKVQQQKVFQFQFIKPSSEPFFIGACNSQTLLGPMLQADVCIQMPASCFQKENYLNLQYDQKRAYYLMYLAQQMIDSNLLPDISMDQLKFNYYNNNPLKPVLEITPPETAGKHVHQKLTIRLFVAAAKDSFKLNRFVPWNNNIRAALYGMDEDGDSVPMATPSYNCNVLFDLTMQENQKFLHDTFANAKNFQEGFLLLKVWLRQRQLDVGYCGFNAHIMAMFIAYLAKNRKLHNNMSSYQVARNVWNHLAFSTWNETNKGITLCDTHDEVHNQPTLEQFHAYFKVVFVDCTGYHNICANLHEDTYKRVRMEAQLAMEMLNDMKLNSFQYLFMSKAPLYTQMDHILKINKPEAVEQVLEMHVSPADKYNFAGYTYTQLLSTVTGLLKKGLDKRISCIMPLEQLSQSWNINETASEAVQHLHLGLILNPDHAYEILDKGPESIDENAASFRSFWGEKAQLRRFQDGTITESVVWANASDDLAKKRLIVRTIVMYLLQHHYQLEAKDIDYIAGEFEAVFSLNKGFKVDNLQKKNITQDTNAEALSLNVIREFDDLSRKLSGLKDLPLEIVSIAGITPVLRYCDPQPLLPQARVIKEQFFANQIVNGIIQLGLSGKWPGELAAFRALKTAFYIQIASLLSEQHKLQCKVTYDGVMVMKHGYCFNLEIAHPKEVGLLKKEKNDKGITQHVDCAESIALDKRHYILPRVAGALKALYQNHSAFGPTVMIAKRWLYSQLIDDGLWPEECTELLIASQFLKASAKFNCNAPQTGFIRFLHLLAHTDWKSELFLLNFNNFLEEKEISELEQSFSTDRDSYPPLCIVTSYDKKYYGKIWSSHQQPNVYVLARVTLLARQCLEIIENTLLSSTLSFIKTGKLFKASSDGYDLVIQIKPEAVPNTLALEFGSSFVEFRKPNWHMPLAGTNFIKSAVAKLREAYGEFAAFFYDACGGKEIAVVWKPNAFDAKEFKVNDINGCSLTTDQKRIQAKKECLMEDFKFILKDFYLRMGSVGSLPSAASSANGPLANGFAKTGNVRYFSSSITSSNPKHSGVKEKSKTSVNAIDTANEKLKTKVISAFAKEKTKGTTNFKQNVKSHSPANGKKEKSKTSVNAITATNEKLKKKAKSAFAKDKMKAKTNFKQKVKSHSLANTKAGKTSAKKNSFDKTKKSKK